MEGLSHDSVNRSLLRENYRSRDLITLYYTDVTGTSHPANLRLYDKREGVKLRTSFREMVSEVQAWGLKLAWVTGDSWYSSLENLKFLKNEKVGSLLGVSDNRQVSMERSIQV